MIHSRERLWKRAIYYNYPAKCNWPNHFRLTFHRWRNSSTEEAHSTWPALPLTENRPRAPTQLISFQQLRNKPARCSYLKCLQSVGLKIQGLKVWTLKGRYFIMKGRKKLRQLTSLLLPYANVNAAGWMQSKIQCLAQGGKDFDFTNISPLPLQLY